jgi:hypothetical protein
MNMWKLKNKLLNGHWTIEEVREEILKIIESNENKNTIYQNLWDTAKTVLKGKFIGMSAYIKTSELSQVNNLKVADWIGNQNS